MRETMLKMEGFRILFAVVLAASLSSMASACVSGTCNTGWMKLYESDSNGNVVSGDKTILELTAFISARVRVIIMDLGMAFDLGDVRELGIQGTSVLCGQSLKLVDQGSWDKFPLVPSWRFMIICTTGYYHEVLYDIGVPSKKLENTGRVGVQWFVKDTPCRDAVYSNTIPPTPNPTKLAQLHNAVLSGFDIRVRSGVPPYTKSVLQDNVQIAGNDVAGQSVWHMTTYFAPEKVLFNSTMTWQFTISSTAGTVDRSLWKVEEHTLVSHTSEALVAMWHVDPCWQHAYTNDQDGKEKAGSLALLNAAVEAGHRVKVIIGNISIEASSVQTIGRHVYAQLLDRVSKKDANTFNNDVYYIWQMVHTTGSVQTLNVLVGSSVSTRATSEKKTVMWFIDSRPWRKAMSTEPNGRVKFGSKADLRSAIQKGADVRVAMQICTRSRKRRDIRRTRHSRRRYCKWQVFAAESLTQGPNEDLSAQLTTTVSTEQVGRYEFQIKQPPSWRFAIATSQSNVNVAEFRVGEPILPGPGPGPGFHGKRSMEDRHVHRGGHSSHGSRSGRHGHKGKPKKGKNIRDQHRSYKGRIVWYVNN